MTKTKTFDGSTREDAENKKMQWLAATKGVIVKDTRVFSRFLSLNGAGKVRTAISMEVIYEDAPGRSRRTSLAGLSSRSPK